MFRQIIASAKFIAIIKGEDWFICENWSHEFSRWNENKPQLEHNYANTQKRNFHEKFWLPLILLCSCICCYLKLSFPQNIWFTKRPESLVFCWYSLHWQSKHSFCIIFVLNFFIKMSDWILHNISIKMSQQSFYIHNLSKVSWPNIPAPSNMLNIQPLPIPCSDSITTVTIVGVDGFEQYAVSNYTYTLYVVNNLYKVSIFMMNKWLN